VVDVLDDDTHVVGAGSRGAEVFKTCSERPRMTARGLPISWAMPAESTPP